MKLRTICMMILAAGSLSWFAFSIDTPSAVQKEEAITQAIQQKNTPQLIKALITHMKDELEKDYDRFPTLIGEVETYTRTLADSAGASILHSMTAEMYDTYYQQNRWRINQRTNLSDFVPDDIREWSANLFTDKVKEELSASLAPATLLQQTPSSQYKEIMESGKDAPSLRPTLYDFLIARAIAIQPTEDMYRQWLAFRRTQDNPKATLLVELEYLHYAYQQNYSDTSKQWYETSLDSLLQQHAAADYSIEILIAKVDFLSQKRFLSTQEDSILAVQTGLCKEGIARFPKYSQTGTLRNMLASWEAPALRTTISNTAYPNDSLSIQVIYNNVRKVHIQLYESKRALAEIANYYLAEKKSTKGRLVKEMTVELPAVPYQQCDTTFRFPTGNTGLFECVVSVPGQQLKTEHWVSVSRLAAVHRLIGIQNEVLVTDFKSGKPIPQATVTWYRYQRGEYIRQASAKTDKDGLIMLPKDSKTAAFQASLPQDTASRFTAIYSPYTPEQIEISQTTVSLFTDRSIYRPGQSVSFKGIATFIGADRSQVVPNQSFTVVLRDANYKEVSTKQFTTNEFGSFHGEFVLPQQTLNGTFNIQTGSSATYFRVEEYKRPTFAVQLDSIRDEVSFGDDVVIRGKAQTFSGVTLTDGNVSWRILQRSFWLGRSTRGGITQVAEGNSRLAADGSFALSFRPEKGVNDKSPFYCTYEAIAVVTDSKGESQETQSYFSVGDAGIVLYSNLTGKSEKDSLRIIVTAQTLNGQPADVSGNWRMAAWSNTGEEAQWSWTAKYQEGKTVASGTFNTGEAIDPAMFRTLPSGRYHLYLKANDSKGREVTLEQDVILYAKEDKQPPVFTHFWIVNEQTTCLPGEEASFYLGTSYKEAHILYEIFNNGICVSRKRIVLSDEIQHFSLPFREEWEEGAVAVFTFIKNGEKYNTSINLTRKQPDKKLTIRPITFRDRLVPGEKESWTFRITDADSLTTDAEMLASMYDASLDKLMPGGWTFAPVRSIHLQAPMFQAGDMFQESDGSAHAEIKTVQVHSYVFDQLNWQGVLYAKRPTPEGIFAYAGEAAPTVMMKASVNADEANLRTAGTIAEEESMDTDTPETTETTVAPLQLRQNFNETAFFYPTLRTNEAGDILFQFTLPESNTTWKFQAVAHTKELKYGQLTKEIVSSKPFMVIPNLPRFFREDDQVTIATQLVNQLEKEINGKVRLEFFDPATDNVIAGWNQPEQTFTLAAKANGKAAWTVTVPKGVSLIGCRIIAESSDGSDGEQHLIPVLSSRILVTESTPVYMLLPGEKTIRIAGEKGSREPFRLTLELTANPVWYAVQALPTLTQPDNDNILSWFAAYYSNTLATHIAASHPRVQRIITLWAAQGGTATTLLSNLEKNEELKNILLDETPWVLAAENETERKQRLALLFDMNRAANARDAALQRLAEQQTAEGGWSWFKGFYTDRTITLSIVKGFYQLEQLQATVGNQQELTIRRNALRYLDDCIRKDFAELKKNNKQWQKATPSPWQLTYLLVRSGVKDMQPTAETQEAIRFYTSQAGKDWTKLSLAGKGETALLMQRSGDKVSAAAVLSWLRKTATTSEELGMYWANNRSGNDFFTSPIDTHCLLMAVFNELSPDSGETDRMKQWLLNQKRTQHWGTVPSSVNAIYTLLLTGSDWLAQDNTVTAQWGGHTFTTGSGESAIGYLKTAVNSNEITAATGTLVLRKEGNTPAWGALYTQYFESIDKVTASKGILNVEKKLFVAFNTGTEQQIRLVTADAPLMVGDKVIVRLTVRTDRDMDYVVLKDIRAGCFEPAEVLSGYSYKDGVGFYRSPKDVSENFFFTRLPKGTFVLEYPVYVSRTGNYAGGISTIQCQYAPEFVSHTEGERLRVND